MASSHQPSYQITVGILNLTAEISERLGRYQVTQPMLGPGLRRANRLRAIQGSLEIENKTLTLEQVTAVVDGRHALGHPMEILEVRNAFKAYEHMEQWTPSNREDLLQAHLMMTAGLVDDPGVFRRGGVGVMKGDRVVHMAPPADQVPFLVDDLLTWLKTTDAHPLLAGCVFHYEFEFIHPFSDCNGRMGRLWQTLILSHWKPTFAFLPIESLIRDHQSAYYQALAMSDQTGKATPFIEFQLGLIRDALKEAAATGKAEFQRHEPAQTEVSDHVTDRVSDQVADQVKALLKSMNGGEAHAALALMTGLDLTHRTSFRKNYL